MGAHYPRTGMGAETYARLACCTVLAGLLMSETAAAQKGQPEVGPSVTFDTDLRGTQLAQAESTIVFDIPPQALNTAILAFAEKAGLQIFYDVEKLSGLSTGGVQGTYTPEQALRRLLAGTNMTYRFSAADTVTLERAIAQDDNGPLQLEPIKVKGWAESAYGPVEGYKASRSATATKTDTPIIDIPASVQVVPREVIEDQNAIRVLDAVRNVSGVQSGGTVGNRSESFIIRGFESFRLAFATGSLLFRLNAAYQNWDNFRDFFIDSDRTQIAPSLRWVISQDTTLDLQLEYYDQEQQFDRGLVAIGDRAGVLPRERYLGERFSQFQANELRFNAILDHRFNEAWSLRALLRTAKGDTQGFVASPLGLQDDGRTLERLAEDFSQDVSNYAVQTNLIGAFETGILRHELLIGLDANFTRFESGFSEAPLDPIDVFNPVYGAQPGAFGPVSTQDRRVDFYGVYFQDLISIGQHWKLLLGGSL